MSEFIFVHLLDKRPVGEELGRSIPLHMTVLHWFESERSPKNIINSAQLALQGIRAMTARASYEDLFGPNRDIPVMRIERAKPLIDLHIALLGAMRKLGAEFDERWTGADNWNPHYTHKSSGRLQPGDSHEVSDIDLITRVSEDGDRMILHRFALESSNR